MKETNPYFSIILPSYNRANFIAKAISSVLQQKFQSWELIVVDDGSIDNTFEVASSFTDSRIIYIWQNNQERSAARNNGINAAKGEYICFLDSDDFYENNHLEILFDEIRKNVNQIALFYIKSTTHSQKKYKTVFDSIINEVIHSQHVCCHREIFNSFKFNISLNVGEDLDLWMKIATKFPVININENTVIILDHEDRTVSYKNTDVYISYKDLLINIFSVNEYKISSYFKKKVLSQAYYNVAKSYYLNNNNKDTLFYLVKSILCHIYSNKLKERIFFMYSVISNKNYDFPN